MNIREIKDLDSMLCYFGENLNWSIDTEDFEVSDYTYEVYSDDLGIKEEEFAKISSLYQMRPLTDNMPFGVFAVTFESKRLEVAALKKILSRLITKKKDNPDYPTWNLHDLIFLCFWGEDSNSYIGVACFDDNDKKLPQLKIEYIQPSNEDNSQIDLFESKIAHLAMPNDTSDTESWRKEWGKAFSAVYHQQITDSQNLAKALAGMAQHTRDTIIETYNVETGLGYVHLLYQKFKESLVHDLDVTQFADMYAQTIAYGLFSAKCMDSSDEFNWQNAIEKIPNTNPFLKTLIRSCFERDKNNKSFFDELELAEIIKLLDNTNIKNILDNFNRRTGGGREDTVIYFYEDFLSAYEHETKKRRGVYYTPWPVVKFMVRAVDDILRTEFGFADGLADTATKTVMEHVEGKKNRKSFPVPAIQILDPATGTGTFLREVILNIHDTFVEKHKGKSDEKIKKLWNEYVPQHLLKRINGFELMMAPYAVAHMKLAMVLKETGYEFESDQRLNVLLTNSLEPSASKASFMETEGQQLSMFEDPLAAEAYDADKTKNNPGINVIIGNPPYSGISSNNNEYITKLIDDYKYIEGEYFNERKHWLNDDYVKFIRYAEEVISKNGNGILAFINNNGFLENPTFRCMRYHLMKSFNSIYIINLHGDITKDKVTIDNNKEENVFDITKGVSINIFVKSSLHNTKCSKLFYKDIYGTREQKYQLLDSDIHYQELSPVEPYYLFVPTTISTDNIYYSGINIDVLFSKNTTGIVTMADEFLVTDFESEIQQHILDFIQNDYSKESFKDKYNLGKNYPDFALDSKGKIVFDKAKIVHISYRPFDNKYTYYDRLLVWRARDEISPHFFHGNNIGLITARSNKSDDCSHFYISRYMSEAKCGERTTQSAIFPLYLYSEEMGKTVRTPNLNSEIVKEISDKLGLPFAPESDGGNTDNFAPIDLLDYIYAVLHSPKYRETYKEFLKIDFPRVPYPTDKEMFWKMVKLGGEIRKLHLMESPLLDTLITRFPLNGSNEVEKITRKENRVYINKTQYFEGISDLAWNFYIGGYQPLQKWLKDRKGRTLSNEDIIHYQKIVVALTETDRLMKEIDEVFVFGEEVTAND